MEFFEAVEKRHSYRGAFTDDPVKREDLIQIVKAGTDAPSGKNAQTTRFIIIDDAELVKKINELHPTNRAMREAKAMIACIVSKVPEKIYHGYSFDLEDCAAAVENMLLAITAKGYASVWIDGWLRVDGKNDKVNELLKIPTEKTVQILLPIGVPAAEVKGPKKQTFEERVSFNQY